MCITESGLVDPNTLFDSVEQEILHRDRQILLLKPQTASKLSPYIQDVLDLTGETNNGLDGTVAYN